MRRILVVNVNWLGDVIFSTPFIRTLKKNYSDSFIASLVVPRCYEILEDNIYLDKIIIYDEKGLHSGIKGKLKLISEIRSYNFDIVYLLHRSMTRTIMCALSGIKERVGYPTKKRFFLLTHKIPYLPKNAHRVKKLLYIAEQMGMATDDYDFDFFIPEYVQRELDNILIEKKVKLEKKFIVINPGANWELKRWPVNKFSELAKRIVEDLGMQVIITGAEKDIPLANKVKKKAEKHLYNLCGYTNLKQLTALLKRSSMVISNDSGPLHISRAVKTPVIGLYGPTSPRITGPIGNGKYRVIVGRANDCQVPCYNNKCKDNRCMDTIKVEEVLQVCDEFMKEIWKIKLVGGLE